MVAPLRWWARRPWLFGWAAVVALVVLPLFQPSYGLFQPYGVWGLLARVLPWLMLIVLLASVIQGARVSWRRSKAKAIIGVLALLLVVPILPPLYSNIGARPRFAKAQTDTRALASAVSRYTAHTGQLPKRLDDLTRPVTNAKGQTAGPFMPAIPKPPKGWTEYRYVTAPGSLFNVCATGEGLRAEGDPAGLRLPCP